MTPPWEGEGVPKLMTKSDDGRRGCLQKVTPLHRKKLLNYSNRHGAKKSPCSATLLVAGGISCPSPPTPWPMKMSTISCSESSVLLQKL